MKAVTVPVILLKWASNCQFFSLHDLEICQMIWKNNGHLFYATSSFVHHFKTIGEFKLELQSRNAKLGTKLARFLFCMTLKFDGWPSDMIGHLSYATLSFIHHFIASGLFKLELKSRNNYFGENWQFLSRLTLKFDRWPWKTIGHLSYTTSSFVHHFIAICEFKLVLQFGNAQIGSKFDTFCPVWPWNLTDDLEKQ